MTFQDKHFGNTFKELVVLAQQTYKKLGGAQERKELVFACWKSWNRREHPEPEAEAAKERPTMMTRRPHSFPKGLKSQRGLTRTSESRWQERISSMSK